MSFIWAFTGLRAGEALYSMRPSTGDRLGPPPRRGGGRGEADGEGPSYLDDVVQQRDGES